MISVLNRSKVHVDGQTKIHWIRILSTENRYTYEILNTHWVYIHTKLSKQILWGQVKTLTIRFVSGNMVTRTCSNLDVETCQALNGVQYCYCRGQLCNVSSKSSNKPPPDDEDIGEGSGSEATLNTKSTTQEQLPKLTTTTPLHTGGSGITASSSLVIVFGVVSLYLLCC